MVYTECSIGSCGNPVFASSLCRKHYEQERLENAVSCSISNCNKKSYRGNLCSSHYRKHIQNSHPKCTVPNCTNHQVTIKSGLCNKHLFRQQRHGSVEQTRAQDWGSREQHPLYNSYHWHKRKGDAFMCQEWRDDFWAFVKDVGERPEGYTLRKHFNEKPIGPDNWYWKEPIDSDDKAEYARKWRNTNPEKAKNADLKKSYGITFKEYNQMAHRQNNRCAICGQKETSTDRNGAPRLMPVDHCHKTGVIRALLCSQCNKALGGFKDDPVLLRKAAEYVEKYKQNPCTP